MAEEPSIKTIALSEAMATVLSAVIGVLTVGALLEPEEITGYTEGRITFEEIVGLMMTRIPNGGAATAARLIRSFGIRLEPAIIDQCFTVFEQDGFPVDSWLADLESRIGALEESQPVRRTRKTEDSNG